MKKAKGFPRVLKQAMKAKGVSASDIQKKTKIPWATLQDYLTIEGSRHKLTPNFKKLVNYLDLSKEQILVCAK